MTLLGEQTLFHFCHHLSHLPKELMGGGGGLETLLDLSSYCHCSVICISLQHENYSPYAVTFQGVQSLPSRMKMRLHLSNKGE